MKIVLERSGGLAGIRRTSSVSTDEMPAEEARKVADLLDKAGFYELPPVIRSTGPEADRFQYKITVEGERGTHVVQVDEAAVSPRLQPVLDWMKSFARTRAGQ
jgi:hypothetical protein